MKLMRFIGESSTSLDNAAMDANVQVNAWIKDHPLYTDDGRSAYTMHMHTGETFGKDPDVYQFWIFLMDPR